MKTLSSVADSSAIRGSVAGRISCLAQSWQTVQGHGRTSRPAGRIKRRSSHQSYCFRLRSPFAPPVYARGVKTRGGDRTKGETRRAPVFVPQGQRYPDVEDAARPPQGYAKADVQFGG